MSYTVSILDSDLIAIESARQILEANHFRVFARSSIVDFFSDNIVRETTCLLVDHRIHGDGAQLQARNERARTDRRIPVIVTASDWDVSLIVKSIKSGADGFVCKPFDEKELLEVVLDSCKQHDESPKGKPIKQPMMDRAASLTGRELEIVSLVTSGMLNKEIAEYLGLALVTVKVHRSNAMRKLGAGNAAELAMIAHMVGLCHWSGSQGVSPSSS